MTGPGLVRAVWSALPSTARWALLGLGRRPKTITLGDLRAMGVRVRMVAR